MPSQYKARRPARPAPTKPQAETPLCEQCGKPARGPAVGEWRFCKPRCRAAYMTARSRRAAAHAKKLKCAFCGKGNEAKARVCAECKQRILWRERSPIWTAIVWSMRLSLLLSLVGTAFMAYQLKNMLGPGGPGNLLSVLGGESADFAQIMGQDSPEGLQGLLTDGGSAKSIEDLLKRQGASPELQDILSSRQSPGELRKALRESGSNSELEAILERESRRRGGKVEDLDAMLERVERGEAANRPEPKVPGPGTWLVGQRGMPPMLFAQNPMDPAFWPEGFGQKPMLEKAKALGGMVTGGKVVVLFGATEVRVVEEGGMFSQVEVTAGSKAGTTGWAQTGQIFEKSAD